MPDLALLVARTLHFWALATLLGGALLLMLLRRPVPRAAAIGLRAAGFVAALAGLAWFALVFADVTGESLLDADARDAFMGAPFGPPWVVRLVLLAALLAIATTRRTLPYVGLGAALVLDQAWLGHAATGSGGAGIAQIAFFTIHVWAGFAWVGALVMLSTLAVADRRVPADALAIFSSLGIAGVATILATGVVNAAFRLARASDLVTTAYGLTLTAKVALVAAMVAIAAYNRRESRTGDVVRPVLLETALGLAVLAAAAMLGVTAPPP